MKSMLLNKHNGIFKRIKKSVERIFSIRNICLLIFFLNGPTELF